MPIGIGGAGFIRGIGFCPTYESPRNKKDPPLQAEASSSSSSSSSSIGKDSDEEVSEEDEGTGVREVRSAYKGLVQGMDSMEESLPIRRGISNFYAGKAKSFTSLSDVLLASCASAKDLAKAENAYTRRQRNLLASKILWEKPRCSMLRSPVGGIVKRPGAPKRSPLALAVAMTSSPNTSNNIGEFEDDNHHHHHHKLLPPFRPLGKSTALVEDPFECSSFKLYSPPIRSFSLDDLPVLKNPDSSIGPSDEE